MAKLGDHLDAVLLRHDDIGHHQVEAGLAEGLDRLAPILGDRHLMLFRGEDVTDRLANHRVVVDEQNLRHGVLRHCNPTANRRGILPWRGKQGMTASLTRCASITPCYKTLRIGAAMIAVRWRQAIGRHVRGGYRCRVYRNSTSPAAVAAALPRSS